MYEENLDPLPAGDAVQAFAPLFSEMQRQGHWARLPSVTPDQVLYWANPEIQKWLVRLSRRLLLPGSGIVAVDQLGKLVDLAANGSSCLVCFNHRSNLDVPTLCALLQDAGHGDLFEKIIWLAGRKLQEDTGLTSVLVQAFNRVVVTPRSWLMDGRSAGQIRQGHLVNLAAHRVVRKLRTEGWVFGLFPTGTRIRQGNYASTRAVPETDTYLKAFQYLLPAHVDGCTLPVSRSADMTHETPQMDRMTITFGEVVETAHWRQQAARRFPALDHRAASARAIMQDIAVLRNSNDDN
ncbi:MAG: 1-acyl-sn-glycerol-3-phosphate acyltransferase [Pirellulaceae bacterium]